MTGLGRETPVVLSVLQSMVGWIDDHVPVAPGHLVIGLGVAMIAGAVAAVGDYLVVAGLPATWDLLAAFRLVVVLGLFVVPVLVVRIGVLLHRWHAQQQYRWLVAIWGVGGAVVIGVAVGLGIAATHLETGYETPLLHLWVVLLVTGLGMLGGLLVGQFYVIALAGDELATAQRDAIAYVQKSLRHHVLNNVNIIEGYATMLEAAVDEESGDDLAAIAESATDLERWVADVGRVNDVIEATPQLRPVSLAAVVDEAVAAADRDETIVVDRRLADAPDVWGDERLSEVFAIVLENVEPRADAATPRVAIEADRRRGHVSVHLVGEGVEIGAERARLLTEPPESGDASLDLYLVQLLAAQYRSDVTVGTAADLDVEFRFPVA